MRMRGLDVVGVEYGGLVSSIFNAAGAAVDVAQQSQAEQAANAKLNAAIAADRAATNAVGKANASAQAAKLDPTRSSAAKADRMAADAAAKAQDKAGAAVPSNLLSKRVDSAQSDLDNAQSALEDALRGSDKAAQMAAQAMVDAAQQTLDKVQGRPSSSGKGGKSGSSGTSFLSKTVAGPVKVWEVLAGAVATVGGVWLWRRHK